MWTAMPVVIFGQELKALRFSYIGFLYLEPEYYGKGVMLVIMPHLKKWSLERGFWN